MVISGRAAERFEVPLVVQPPDIDQLGHVNNVVYLRWVQEAATAHWFHLTSPEQQARLVWVVVRHEIDYRRAASLEDALVAVTWVGPARKNLFERHTEILRAGDRALLARATTLWCPIDPRTGRPVKVGEDVRKLVSVPAVV